MNDKYFWGSGSPNGFFSCFDLRKNYDGGYTYILKGGPGTGKSSLMKKIAKFTEENDISCSRYFCSSDPDSLDAIVFPSLRIRILDGTAPHIADPVYPGAADEIINLGDCWNINILKKNKEKIIEITDKNREYHEKSKRFNASAFSLYSEGADICHSCIDKEKLRRYASRIATKKIKRLSSKIGIENKRLLEAITPKGFMFMRDTVIENCDEIILLKDDFGAASSLFLEEIRNYAVASGYDVIVSPSVRGDKSIRHIIIKELSVGFVSEDIFMKPDIIPSKTVYLNRFYDSEKLKAHKVRLRFLKNAAKELMDEAVSALNDAKKIHDELEKLYVEAMDFGKLDEITENLKNRIWNSEWFTE